MTRQSRLSITIALAAILVAGTPAARASDLWPGAFKSYEQIESEILAVEVAHPEIVDVVSIGQSYEGRELYAAKISDNVALEEGEPEVLIDALHHSNEHVTVAQALDLLHTLVDGYGDLLSCETPTSAAKSLTLAYDILQGARMRQTKTEYVACPSCGRTLFDIQATTLKIKERTGHLKSVTIAVMGCIVNGPGEMADADFGYVGGAPGKINLYVGKTPVQFNIPQEEAVERLVDLIKAKGKWMEPS